MDAQTFLDNFGTIADAPGGVDSLREFILGLAVAGALSGRPIHPATGYPPSWESTTLGQFARLRRGFDLPKQDRDEGGVPIYGANGQVGTHNEVGVAGPGVVTGRSGSIGKVHFVEEGFWPLNTSLYVENFYGNDPRYVAIVLKSVHLERFSSYSAVPTLNRNVAHRERVGAPPLDEQKRIVAKVDELMLLCDDLEARQHGRRYAATRLRASSLDALTTADTDDGLHTAWSRIHTNWEALTDHPNSADALRQAILQLAVTGKLSERDARDVPLDIPGLTDTDNRPQGLPARWHCAVLDSLGAPGERATADGPFGSKLKTSHYVDTAGYRVIRLGNIGLGYFKDADRSFITQDHFQSLAGYHLRSGDIVVASLGNPSGRACVVPDSVLPALNKADCFRVRVHPDINNAFIALVLNAPMSLTRAADLNRGDTRGRISLSHLKTTPIPLPPRAEQDRIVEHVQYLLDLCDRLQLKLIERDSSAQALAAALTKVGELANDDAA